MPWYAWNRASRHKLEQAENEILRRAMIESIKHGPKISLHAEDVETSEPGEVFHVIRAMKADSTSTVAVHDVDVECNPGTAPIPIVIWHGFGSGAAAFANNLVGLGQIQDGEVIAVDLLGCGLSSRPAWTATSSADAQRWFLESFERLRNALNLDRFVLLGHSLGGYLAAQYTLKYPHRVSHLVLASPVGVPHSPLSNLSEEVRKGQEDEFFDKLPWRRALFFRVATKLWKSGATPQRVVRYAGPWGRYMVSRFLHRRFESNLSIGLLGFAAHEEIAVDYFYHNAALASSGENALTWLLTPGAWAVEPLQDVFPKMSRNVPISFLYGDRDWMDSSPVAKMTKEINIHRLSIIPDAGHHLYIDNWLQFNRVVAEALVGGPQQGL